MWSPHFDSPGWPQLASAGLDWPRLASAGIGWPRLVSARLRLPQLAPAGFGWLHLWWCPGLWSRNQLAGWLVASSAVCPPAWCAGQLGGARLAGWLRLRFAGCPPRGCLNGMGLVGRGQPATQGRRSWKARKESARRAPNDFYWLRPAGGIKMW